MDENWTHEGPKVTATDSMDAARDWAAMLEDKERRRTGAPLEVVRSTVARRIGVPASKLQSLRKNRLKDVGHVLFTRLRLAIIDELQAEMRHAEHEIQILRQIGADPCGGEMLSALGRRQKVREALGLEE